MSVSLALLLPLLLLRFSGCFSRSSSLCAVTYAVVYAISAADVRQLWFYTNLKQGL